MESGLTRAQRFATHALILYRASGEHDWHQGSLENISRSGMLFRVEQMVDIDTTVEMNFMLPVETLVKPGVEVIYWGGVVRRVLPSATDTHPGLAAKFWAYQPLHVRAESVPRLLYWHRNESETSESALALCDSKVSS